MLHSYLLGARQTKSLSAAESRSDVARAARIRRRWGPLLLKTIT